MKIDEIWSEYRLALQRFLQSKVSIEADVEDLLQEILIKTHHNLASVKKQNSIKAWLFQLANNTIIDYYRRKGRNQAVSVEDFQSDKQMPNSKVDLSHCIAAFIQALPEENAKLLIAIDINNQSQKQYAEQHGLSYSTVKSRVQKSRHLLKQVFDDCCHFKIDKLGNVYDYDPKNNSRPRC
jgi:RNA polymerase sigma-70 factor (ECF subfamily)